VATNPQAVFGAAGIEFAHAGGKLEADALLSVVLVWLLVII
jgi:hypothetical protein